jgi:hypothetical protein
LGPPLTLPLDHVTHPKLPTDFAHVPFFKTKAEVRPTTKSPGTLPSEFVICFGYSVAEIFLVLRRAEIDKRQNGDGAFRSNPRDQRRNSRRSNKPPFPRQPKKIAFPLKT